MILGWYADGTRTVYADGTRIDPDGTQIISTGLMRIEADVFGWCEWYTDGARRVYGWYANAKKRRTFFDI